MKMRQCPAASAKAVKIGAMVFDLKIDQPDLMAVSQRRRGDKLEPERLEAQEDFCVHQGAGMDAEHAHEMSPVSHSASLAG